MKYLDFEKTFRHFPIFSIKDIQKLYPGFDNRRLVEWQQKNYILKVRRGYYCFVERRKNEHFLYFGANKIYRPSYVSFESALPYYQFIPEGVFTSFSATTRNTANFSSPIGNFVYKHIRPSLFFWYRLIQEKGFTLKMTEPEKVLLDYFYSNKNNSVQEMDEKRFNEVQSKEIVDFEKLENYLKVFDSKIVYKRIEMFKESINA